MTSNRSDSATEQIIATEQILKGKLINHGVRIMFYFISHNKIDYKVVIIHMINLILLHENFLSCVSMM